GRELCCSTWLTDFKSVSTTAARYQNLSLNPSKLSGQCGRLKCCLNYELETYMEALKDIPTVNRPLQTQQGDAILQKTDIFKRMMWFGYKGDNNWYPVPVERVQEILEQNAKGIAVEMLVPEALEEPKQNEFVAQVEGSLERLDDKFKSKKKKKKKKKKPAGVGAETQQQEKAAEAPQAKKEKQDRQAQSREGDQEQKPRRQRPPRNKNRNKEGREGREPRENREPKEQRQPKAPKPDAQASGSAPEGAAPQQGSGEQRQKKRSRKPFRGKKPDQGNKPTRTDA
ncbi:MAG: Signal peptidase-like protein, partial [Pontibacter sp.]|nr:Signal peptidase-like protein [Pontibacter sp.]